MKARIRKDLREKNLAPAVQIIDSAGNFLGTHLPAELINADFEYNQPDALLDDEYNAIICHLPTMKAFRINSIELEFGDEESNYAIMVTRSFIKRKEVTVVAKSYEEAVAKVDATWHNIDWDSLPFSTDTVECS